MRFSYHPEVDIYNFHEYSCSLTTFVDTHNIAGEVELNWSISGKIQWKWSLSLILKTYLSKPLSSDSLCKLGKAVSVLLFTSSDFSPIACLHSG